MQSHLFLIASNSEINGIYNSLYEAISAANTLSTQYVNIYKLEINKLNSISTDNFLRRVECVTNTGNIRIITQNYIKEYISKEIQLPNFSRETVSPINSTYKDKLVEIKKEIEISRPLYYIIYIGYEIEHCSGTLSEILLGHFEETPTPSREWCLMSKQQQKELLDMELEEYMNHPN